MRNRKPWLGSGLGFARRFASRRWAAPVVLVALLPGTGLAQTTLVPSSYVTTSGSDSGAPVSNIQVLDQSGLGNNPAKQVTFRTSLGVTYAGYRVYDLPTGIAASTLATIQVQVNYQGPDKKTQTWTWKIFDWVHNGYVSIGDNMMAYKQSAWKILSFNVPGNLSNYVRGTGQIQVQVISNNSAGNCNIDYEALVITTSSTLPPQGPYFYVSTTGNDANPGSISAPWRTIRHAANMLGPGNTAYVRGGVYKEQVSIPTSGSATGGYITFQSFPGETATVDGTGLVPGNQTGLFDLQSKSYIRIIGFEIRNFKTATTNVPAGINIQGAGDHIELRRNVIHDIVTSAGGTNGNAFGLAVYGTQAPASINNLIIDGNELRNLKTGCSESLTLNGNVQYWRVTNNASHDNNNIGIDTIGFEGTSPDPAYDQARDGLVAGNLVYNITVATNPCYTGQGLSADGIYSDGGTRLIIERNIVHHADIGIELASEHFGRVTSYITARNNLVYSSQVVGFSIGGYAAAVGGTDHVTIVNNTLFKNDTHLTGSGEFQIQYHATNDIFENNLVYANGQALFVNDFTTSTPQPVTANYDLYWSSVNAANSNWVWQGKSITGFANYQTASKQDANSLYANPQLVSTTAPDLYDLPGSPANDAGTNLGSSVVGTVDQNGFNRVQGANIDIGAFEQ